LDILWIKLNMGKELYLCSMVFIGSLKISVAEIPLNFHPK
jgi:hypothetical protein